MSDFWHYVAVALYMLGVLNTVLLISYSRKLDGHEHTKTMVIVFWPLLMPFVFLVVLFDWCKRKVSQ